MSTNTNLTFGLAVVLFCGGSIDAQTFRVSGNSSELQDLDLNDGFDFESELEGPWTVRFFVPDQSGLTIVSNDLVDGGSRTVYSGVVISDFELANLDFAAATQVISGEVVLWDRADFNAQIVEVHFAVGDSSVSVSFPALADELDVAFGQMFHVNTPKPNTLLDSGFIPVLNDEGDVELFYSGAGVEVDAFPSDFGGRGLYSGTTLNFNTSILSGDVNLDGRVNLQDVTPFVDVLLNGPYQVEADANYCGMVSLQDITPFIQILNGDFEPDYGD